VTDTREPPVPATRSVNLTIPGPAGTIEGALDRADAEPRSVAVICHPHPLQQGTMNNKVVTTLARAFARHGAAAVRFNFRGVGASAGSYGDGVGERADARAVIAWSRERWPGLPLFMAGFSFGAAIALAIAVDAAPQGLVAVAPPIERLPDDFRPPSCPWLIIHGRADEVVPVEPVIRWARAFTPPPELVLPEGVGHFFHGRLALLPDAVEATFGAALRAASA
jgi:alpha/beta superfamily hydrolase